MLVAASSAALWVSSVPALARPKPSVRISETDASAKEQKPGKELLKPEGPAPTIKAVEPVHDFGTTWVGPTLKHAFTIKNEGDATLEITKVRPACGCTVAGSYPKKLEPGESGNFPFSINSKKLRGKYEKSITISSNDPLAPSLKLKLRGECKRYVDVLPTNANFGKITDNMPRERVLKITNNTEGPLEVSLTKTEDAQFTFELVEKTPGQEYELLVKVDPPFVPGTRRGKTTLITNKEAQKEIRVGATARIPERLEVQPPAITLNVGKMKAKGYSRPVRFTNYGSSLVKVLEATSDDPENIQLLLKERTPGKAYIINVDIPAGYTPPLGGAKITLKTDDPNKPSITIPVNTLRRKTVERAKKKRPAEEMIGKPAPTFSLATTAGKSLSTDDLKGKVTVLDFFAVNCGFCKKQIPRLEQVRKTYEEKGVRFVTVSQTMRKKFTDDDVKNKIKELGFQGELAIDHDNTAGPLFKATSFPTMVLVGKSGKIEAVNIGNVADLEKRMKGQLDAMLAGKPVPQLASATPPKPDKPRKRPAEEMIGKPAPTFSLATTAGKSLSTEGLKGKVTVLDFFAVNCGFCKKQIPRLEQVRKTYEGKGVRFVTVSQTMRKKFSDEKVKNTIKELGFQGELAIDHDNTAGPLFKATSFPTMVLVGKTGKIEAVNIGNVADLEKRMKGQLDAMLAGKPVPQLASTTPPKPDKPRKRPVEELVGKPAPKFELTTTDGKKLSTGALAGKVTVLDFFAVNCGYCKKQLPRVEGIRKTYADKGVRFVSVSQTMRKEFTDDEVKAKLKEFGFQGELAINKDNSVGRLFHATGFPTMVIIGKTGKVEAVNIGNVADLETRMKGQLDALLAGKPVPQFARKTPPKKPAETKAAGGIFGKPAPKFALTTTDGKKVSNDALAGKVAVLDFFAPNCGFCKKQLPRVEAIRKTYADKGVRFVAVSETMRKKFTEAEVKTKLKEFGFQGELAIDSGNKVGRLFQARGFPTMVVLGKTGKVEAINTGNIADLETKLKAQLDALLAGKAIPQFAATTPTKKPTERKPADSILGKPAPKFALTSTDGKKVSNEALAGKIAVLDFFAANCGFCKKQLPRVEEIRKAYADKGVRFVAVSETMRKEFTEDEVKAKLKEFGFQGELTIDSGNKVGRLFQARGFPTMVVLGKTGKVEAINIGNIADLETKLKGQLDALVAGKPIPEKYASKPRPASKSAKRPALELVGKPAPAFTTLKTLQGKEISNAGFAKHPVTVLNFVAPNCGYCKKQIPKVESIRAEYEKKGVRFVNVAQTMRKKYETEEVVKTFKGIGSNLEIAHDGGNAIGQAFKAVSFPTMVVISKDGKIEHVNIGAKADIDTLLKGQLDKMLAAASPS